MRFSNFIIMEGHKWNSRYMLENCTPWPDLSELSWNVCSLDLLFGLWKSPRVVGFETEVKKKKKRKSRPKEFSWSHFTGSCKVGSPIYLAYHQFKSDFYFDFLIKLIISVLNVCIFLPFHSLVSTGHFINFMF